MEKALIELLIAIAGLAITAVTSYVVPWLKAQIRASRYRELWEVAYKAVRAMNQTIPPEEWERKKEVVTEYLRDYINYKLNLNINEYDLDILIEGIVNKVKEEKQEAEKGQL